MAARKKERRLAYYITAHGLGHAVRSFEVIRNLLEQAPDLKIVLVSTIPEHMVKHNLRQSLPIRKKQLDIGLVQHDSLRFDLVATLKALEGLHSHREALLAEEAHFFKTEEIQGIVCDIPFLPFTAASRWGIPAIGIGNFTWDWVYDAYAGSDARWSPLVSWIRQSQQGCSLFLQLPMHGDCSSCPAIRPVPLVARRATKKPEQTRKILGLESQQKAYLVSFVALDLKEEALARLQRITNAVFLYRHPLSFRLKNGICLDDFDISYSDVVAAVDGVITKPGYGIVSECLVHGTPMIYADRGLFPEYGILVKEMEKHLTALYLPSRDLYAGRWEAAVRKLENEPRRFPVIQDDGAQVCAETILGFLAR